MSHRPPFDHYAFWKDVDEATVNAIDKIRKENDPRDLLPKILESLNAINTKLELLLELLKR